MIRLERGQKPKELTDSLQKELTDLYINEEKKVWGQKFLKEALLALSNSKCCYCECKLEIEDKYMEVEHFYPKKLYPKEVIKWDNLLPSCGRCNKTKRNHDTLIEPIIDPSKIDPKDHLRFNLYRIEGTTPLGQNTEDVLNLNDSKKLCFPRFLIGEALFKEINKNIGLIDEFLERSQNTTRQKNRIVRGIKDILSEGLPESEFSFASANIIIYESRYYELKSKIKKAKLWDREHDELEFQVKSILPKRILQKELH